jgi:hypothetical protein
MRYRGRHGRRKAYILTGSRPPAPRARTVVAVLGLALVLALLTQQALAAQLGRWLAGVWMSTVEVVLRLLAPLFGG